MVGVGSYESKGPHPQEKAGKKPKALSLGIMMIDPLIRLFRYFLGAVSHSFHWKFPMNRIFFLELWEGFAYVFA